MFIQIAWSSDVTENLPEFKLLVCWRLSSAPRFNCFFASGAKDASTFDSSGTIVALTIDPIISVKQKVLFWKINHSYHTTDLEIEVFVRRQLSQNFIFINLKAELACQELNSFLFYCFIVDYLKISNYELSRSDFVYTRCKR